ncbi:MAG: acyltransferase [Pseudomonadota bacterium]
MTISNLASPAINQNKSGRLLFLDGLRGIAILLVVFFHAFADSWNEILPYQFLYSEVLIFKFGNYGVQLFFIISGFVISMTLETCAGFWGFMYRRWIRLFPAMLIASLIILISAPLFTARPYGQPSLMDILPGITFIEPELYRWVFGYNQQLIEGVFWTLFVEMKFYILAGILYFTIGSRKMIVVLILMFLSSIVFEFANPYLPAELADQLNTIIHYLNYRHYGWFAAGALFYQYYRSKNKHYWLAAVLLGLLAARCLGGFMSISMLAASLIVLIFAGSMFSPFLQNILSNRVLLFFGFISYPLYLIHEQAMISMIIQLNQHHIDMPLFLLPMLPIIGIIFAAWIIAQYLEPALKQLIKQLPQLKIHIMQSIARQYRG